MSLIKSLKDKIGRRKNKEKTRENPTEIINFAQQILFEEMNDYLSDEDWENIELIKLLVFTRAFNISLLRNLSNVSEGFVREVAHSSANIIINAYLTVSKIKPSDSEKKSLFLSVHKDISEQTNEYTQSLYEDLKEPEGIMFLADTIQTIKKNIFGGIKSEQPLSFELAEIIREHIQQFQEYINSCGYK